jgi:hypothetical protein
MDATMDKPLSDYPDPSQALGGEINCIDPASYAFNYPDPSLVLERVSGCLDDALRSFAEGDSEQACRYLAEANFVFESSQAEVKSEAVVTPTVTPTSVTPISKVASTSPRPVEREQPLLARAATA